METAEGLVKNSLSVVWNTCCCYLKRWFFQRLFRCESGPERRLSTKELILSNCGAGEELEGPLDCEEIKPVHPKGNQP